MPRRAPGRSVQELEALLSTRDRQLVSEQTRGAELARENAELRRARDDSVDQQTATADVLRVIAAAPTDLQKVLDAIVASAAHLCDAESAAIHEREGDRLPVRARAVRSGRAEAAYRADAAQGARTGGSWATRGTVAGRAILDRCTVHVEDLAVAVQDEFPDARTIYERMGFRTLVGTPLLRRGEPIGILGLHRFEVRPFTAVQIKLLETFADQAVIAIENARLFAELEERNAQLTEALEQQTATAEVLQVISRSPTELQAVLDTIAESAARLCQTDRALVFRVEGDTYRPVAGLGSGGDRASLDGGAVFPLDRDGPVRRAILDRAVFYVHDLAAVPPDELPAVRPRALGVRTTFVVPLLRDGVAIGAISLARREVKPFTEQQVKLVQTFADQAVIAIENARLFSELQERNQELSDALEQQTATGRVLEAISRSPTDLPAVLETICESAGRLCGGLSAIVSQVEGDSLRRVASWSSAQQASDLAEALARYPEVSPSIGEVQTIDRAGGRGQAVRERRTVYVPDVQAMPEETADERGYGRVRRLGIRTTAAVPLLRAGEAVGVLSFASMEPDALTDPQVRLLESFADQAVIAIENTRLFGELQQRTEELTRSVERLTALFEVGRAVGGTLDLQRVLDTVVARASDLAGADGGAVYEYDPAADAFTVRAAYRMPEEMVAAVQERPIRLGETVVGQAAAERAPVQYADVRAEEADARTREALERAGYRAVLAVPLLRETAVVGILVVRRTTPGAFDPDTVVLLQTFANQSALAIQNARLFQELADKSTQLEDASRHKSEFLANMSHELRTPLNAVIGFTEVLLERYFGEINPKQEEYLQDVLSSGQHLLSLINDILDLSKVEAGRMELEVSAFDLGPVLEAGLVMVRERASRKGVVLSLSVAADTGRVEADERKVKQVLFNLLTNAVKFTPDGGAVTVTARRRGGQVKVAVADTGVGIAPEDQARVFEEFGQARSASGQSEGTGLGLALVKRYVELHGGEVAVESAVGKGSTFTVALPARQPRLSVDRPGGA